MSKKLFVIGLLIPALSPAFLSAQQQQLQQQQPNVQMPMEEEAPTASTEGRVFDEGQVQMPREGQVESSPEGQVEAINPTGYQPPSRDTQPDLFRFESRLFRPIPSDE